MRPLTNGLDYSSSYTVSLSGGASMGFGFSIPVPLFATGIVLYINVNTATNMNGIHNEFDSTVHARMGADLLFHCLLRYGNRRPRLPQSTAAARIFASAQHGAPLSAPASVARGA